VATPIGTMTVVGSADGVRAILWDGERAPDGVADDDDGVLADAVTQLEEYFAGDRTEFDVLLDLAGTDFQVQAWRALADVPFGTTVSYGEQARRLGRPTAFRAVGAANGRNPVPIVLPCHRVVGADGSLTGFGGGLDAKRWLLDHEQRDRLF
jgi:methylated-DNA-[protein]-cysteine S-methyltransferase